MTCFLSPFLYENFQYSFTAFCVKDAEKFVNHISAHPLRYLNKYPSLALRAPPPSFDGRG